MRPQPGLADIGLRSVLSEAEATESVEDTDTTERERYRRNREPA